MTCGVYIIKNTINNKIYIGSSCDIEKRWAAHKQQQKFLIGRAMKKYGIELFYMEILEETTECVLLDREQYYLDTLKPFDSVGYNICKIAGRTTGIPWSDKTREKQKRIRKKLGFGKWNIGRIAWNRGKEHSQETRQRISTARKGKPNWRAQQTLFRSPSGELVEFKSINAGSKERGLHVSCMAEVARGKRKQYKGWTCPDGPEWTPAPRCNHVVLDPKGNEHHVTNIKDFCEIHSLNLESMRKVLTNNGQAQHKGWRLPGADVKTFHLRDPNGEKHTVFEIKSFAEDNNLSYTAMRAVVCGNQKQHKGWMICE